MNRQNDINWDGLRYFLASADAGSLTAASKLLGSNQPTVGRHIDNLESALGIKLFQRSVRGLILTPEGQDIYEQSKHIQNSIIKIQRVAECEKESISGIVNLSIPEGLAHEIIIPALEDFYKKQPNINLVLNISSSTSNLSRGEADIAIRLFRPNEVDLVARHLGKMKMSLFLSRIYKEKYSLPKNLDDLKTHKIITYGEQLSSLPENKWLINNSDSSSHIFSSDSTAARLKATLSGIGISIQPEILAKSNTDLLPVLNNINIPAHDVWLVYHKDIRHMKRIRAVVDFLIICLSQSL